MPYHYESFARTRGRRAASPLFAAAVLAIVVLTGAASTARAELTVTPITWDIVGLDHNRPLTEGPELFPVGAEVCSDTATTDVAVDMVWDDPDDTWVINRPGSLTSLTFDSIAAGECIDAYFEVQVTRGAGAFGEYRPYRIVADDGASTAATPDSRAIYVQELVSQNRNSTERIRWGQEPDESDWQVLGEGSGLNLEVGESYFIELTTETATDYEQLQSFLTLSNTIFQVKSVSTTYSTLSAPASRVPQPNPRLWADGCLWDSDIDSPNWRSCLSDGKAGGTVVTVYEIDIISGGGDSIGLEALIYDRSGGSFHYNTDFSQSPGELVVFEPAAPGFDKRFIPDTIGADGKATVRLTISNPNPIAVSDYSFTDNLPSGMEVAGVPNLSNSCGGTASATAGGSVISLDGGALEANSTCAVLADVTAPPDTSVTYPLTLSNSVDLLVGDPGDPEFVVNATDELEVTEFPPPPQECTPNTVAAWDSFDSASTPTATADPESRSPAAEGGSGLTFATATINGRSVWNAFAVTANQDLSAAIAAGAYYQFSLDTAGLDTLDFALEAFRQNGNAPEALTLFWGTDATSLNQSVTISPVPTRNNSAGFRNLRASGLGNLDDGSDGDGRTLFRVYAYAASNTNQAVSILDVLLSSGETCVDADPSTAPDPPQVSKQFESPPGTAVTSAGLGQQLTLAFTITNPNGEDALTGLNLIDALPTGLVAVSGTFVNNCIGGTWTENPQGVLALDDSSLDAGASCTLSVDVEPNSVGELTNLSDPVDANETLAGNSARASLTVEAPPATPSIVKFFDPNPLLDPGATTRLVFRITNNDDSLAISDVAFTDVLPAGLNLAGALSETVTNCGSPTLTASAADTLEFSGGTIPANTDPGSISENVCEVGVDVVLADPGVSLPVWFDNTSGPVSHVFNGAVLEGNRASATLLVDTPFPGVRLLKQVGPAADIDGIWSGYRAVPLNTDVHYKYTIENVGESELSAISLSDPDLGLDVTNCTWTDTQGNALPSGFTLPVADFADPEAHIAVCIVGPETITQAAESTTVATVEADAPSSTVQDNDSATVAGATLELQKAADPVQFTAAGETIAYTFTVTNPGPAILRDPVEISDLLVPGASCPPLSSIGDSDNFFSAGDGSLVCGGNYTTTSTDVDNGQVVNTATASTPEVASPEAGVTVPLASAALTIAKTQVSGPSPVVAAGVELGYEIVIKNTGTVDQTGVDVSDTLPDGSTGVLTGPGESANADGVLEVGETWRYTIAYTVTQADIDAGSDLVNTARVSTTEVPGPTTDTATTPVTQNATLTLVKTGTLNDGGDGVADAGDTISYAFTVENTGNVTLTNISVTDPQVTLTGGPISLAPGAVDATTFTAAYTLTQADIDAGTFTNTATANSNEGASDTDSDTRTLAANPALSIAKALTDAPDPIEAGSVLTYTVTASNTGNVTLNNLNVSDDLIDPSSNTCATLAVGDDCVLSGTYEVIQADIDAGQIENTGMADSDQTDPVEDMLTTPVGGGAAIALIKTGTFNDTNGDGFAQVGETISYAFTVTNTGNVTLTEIEISDPLMPVAGGPVDLDPGASDATTFTGEYTLTQDDLDGGQVTNQAMVTGRDPVGDPVTDPSDNDNNIEDDPTVTTLSSPPPSGPGQPLPVPLAGWWMVLMLAATLAGSGVQRLRRVQLAGN